MNILQINAYDLGGGAAKTAWRLFESYQRLGHNSSLAVGYNLSHHPSVYEIPGARRPPRYARFLWKIHSGLQPLDSSLEVVRSLRDLLRTWGSGESVWTRLRGREQFGFPKSHGILDLVPNAPDVVHCHNLHGGYFDLRSLAPLSRRAPVVLTLHDAWLLSGHCAHSFACDRWRTGCGKCPDLSIYPSLFRDGTAENWREKRRIFEQSRIFVATPCHWLMNKVEQSFLRPIDCKVIANGVDRSIFKPGSKDRARTQLGIPPGIDVLLYVGSADLADSFKDFKTLRDAVVTLSAVTRHEMRLLCICGERATECLNHVTIEYMSHIEDERVMALHYQAADVVVHAANEETFPYVVLEAMACGTPVIASAVGGVPEQIQDGITGLLVPPRDVTALARSISRLMTDVSLRTKLASQATRRIRSEFDLETQVKTYLNWYMEIQSKEWLC